jgi:hypothetical protein
MMVYGIGFTSFTTLMGSPVHFTFLEGMAPPVKFVDVNGFKRSVTRMETLCLVHSLKESNHQLSLKSCSKLPMNRGKKKKKLPHFLILAGS